MTEFVPLHDEEDGALKAGIRFWQIAPDKPLRMTLYELDGYPEYIRRKSKNIEVLKPKRMYKLAVRGNDINSTEIYDGENYHVSHRPAEKQRAAVRDAAYGRTIL